MNVWEAWGSGTVVTSQGSKLLGLVQVNDYHHGVKRAKTLAAAFIHLSRFIILCEIQFLYLLSGIIIHLAGKL